MPDTRYWTDASAREALMSEGRDLLDQIRARLEPGVVAIEPRSGDYFWGATLGQANEAARARYPDRWLYFGRVEELDAEIVLPTW